MTTLRYVIFYSELYEGQWPAEHAGTDADPLPTFDSRERAQSWAKSRKINRSDIEIHAVKVES